MKDWPKSYILQNRLRDAPALPGAGPGAGSPSLIGAAQARSGTGGARPFHGRRTRHSRPHSVLPRIVRSWFGAWNCSAPGTSRPRKRFTVDVLVKNPEDVDAMRLLSGLAMRASQWRDAEAMLKRTLELAPDFYQGWMDLGLAQQELDKPDEAQQSYRRAGRLEPAAAAPHVAIGTTLAMSGRHAGGGDCFQTCTGAGAPQRRQPDGPGSCAQDRWQASRSDSLLPRLRIAQPAPRRSLVEHGQPEDLSFHG